MENREGFLDYLQRKGKISSDDLNLDGIKFYSALGNNGESYRGNNDAEIELYARELCNFQRNEIIDKIIGFYKSKGIDIEEDKKRQELKEKSVEELKKILKELLCDKTQQAQDENIGKEPGE